MGMWVKMSPCLQDADAEGVSDGKLNFEEFCTLFDELSERKELTNLFALYSSKQEWLTVRDLQNFFKIEQGMFVCEERGVCMCVRRGVCMCVRRGYVCV